MTNLEGFNSLTVLRELHEERKLGFAIARNIRKLESEIADYIEKRDELIRKYGEENGPGQYVVKAEGIKDFLKELDEYGAMEFEFQPQLVDQETFCSGSLTSDQMYILDWMVKE